MPQTMSSSVDLVAIGSGTWRVCDIRFEDGDPRRIVGYLREDDHARFEMMWMRPRPGIIRVFASLEGATSAIDAKLH
jgi:hypothetical protein